MTYLAEIVQFYIDSLEAKLKSIWTTDEESKLLTHEMQKAQTTLNVITSYLKRDEP